MSTYGPLFDICYNYHKGNKCSIEANKIAHKGKENNKQRVINAIRQSWYGREVGLTCEQIEQVTGISHQTCSARLSELKRECKIKIVGTRKTKSGSPASVYQAI